MSRQGSPLATAAAMVKTFKGMTPLLRAASGLTIIVACLALTLGVLGWMKPVLVPEGVSTDEVSQSVTFSYSAKVPVSPVYDGTVASSPDPIFRKLASHVDVRIKYQGRPGTMAVTADLSTGSGWHTTTPLAPPKQFTGRFYDGTVTLDLDAIEGRAEEAAKVIGIEAGPVSVTVNAEVTSGSRAPFNAGLNLQLDDIRLRLTDNANSLVVGDTTRPEPALVPREIGLPGTITTTAAQARSYAVLLLLAAGFGAVVIALVARRKLPLRSRAEIEQRFGNLLVPVEPMASPPGKPVVNVDNFPALVKLAERYGQMILTWRRPDADDFVVRDEGITYRYRIPLEEPTLQDIEHVSSANRDGAHRRKASSPVS